MFISVTDEFFFLSLFSFFTFIHVLISMGKKTHTPAYIYSIKWLIAFGYYNIVFSDDHYIGGPVDIWALGVLLYFMVIGNMPFRAPTVPALRSAVLKGDYSLPAALSVPCLRLLREYFVVILFTCLLTHFGQMNKHGKLFLGKYHIIVDCILFIAIMIRLEV